MRNLNSRLLLAAAASIGMTAIASAADLAARTWTKAPMMDTPACAWCGWYVGGNGGFAFGNTTGNLTSSDVGFASSVAAGLIPTALGAKHDGGYGGGQFGYNFVTSNVLIGFEADIQGANIGSANTISLTNGTDSTSATTGRDRIDWFGTARGRLGYSFGSVVLFGTGGLAFGGVGSQIQNNIAINGIGGQANTARSGDSTAVGWAAGAGFEWMFAPHWSFKTEYLHVDLGSTDLATVASGGSTNSGTYHFGHAFNSARLGINYHFSGY